MLLVYVKVVTTHFKEVLLGMYHNFHFINFRTFTKHFYHRTNQRQFELVYSKKKIFPIGVNGKNNFKIIKQAGPPVQNKIISHEIPFCQPG